MFSLFNRTSYVNNPDLALKLFETLSVSTGTLTQKEQSVINDILSTCKTRQDILNKVVEICGEPNTSQKRYIYAMAYSWSNKEYRKKAIKYLELYLSNPLYEDVYLNRFSYYNEPIESRKNNHLNSMHQTLGEIYEKEYDFDNALINYEKAIQYDPYNPITYRKKVGTLIKMNKIEEAIIFLDIIKKSKYYVINNKYMPIDWFIKTIDELLEDCKKKQKENYLYKPRKQNITYVE
ncbi:MAG: DnaD domain protein [Oscillospiraceae bacterium]|nr:DnaD domain protein [Oscillospiraceae bacterium]